MASDANTFDYIVELKHKSTKHITIIGLLLLVFVYLLFFYTIIFKNTTGFNNKSIAGLISMILSITMLIVNYFKYKKEGKFYMSSSLGSAAFIWFCIPKLEWMLVLYLILAFLDRPLKVTPEYGFDENGITYNSFPEKKYNWDEITNVVINFGMLTIDFSNNKIIQSELNEDISIQLEKEFNQFCKLQIEKNSTNL